jgi:hypothetical protein
MKWCEIDERIQNHPHPLRTIYFQIVIEDPPLPIQKKNLKSI